MAKLLLGSVVGPQGPQGTPGVNGSQGPQGIPGPNEVTATTDVVGLTSGQLLYNKSGKLGSVDIVDNLLSIDPDKPLSANQGKVLKSLIDDNSSAIGQNASDLNAHKAESVNKTAIVNNLLATEEGFVLDARQGKAINDNLNSSYLGLRTHGVINDYNNLTQKGFYQMSSPLTNSPGFQFLVLEVVGAYAYIIQRATNISNNTTKQRVSTDGGSTWSGWKSITIV